MMARTAPKKVSPKRTATKTKTRSAKSDANTVNALKSASREVAGADTFKPNVPETLAERYPLATAILSVRWPSVEQLREIIRACRSMADTLRVNVLTTAEDCPLKLPTVRSNPRAIDAAVAEVEDAYAIKRLCPTQSGKSSKVPVFLGPNVVTGWGHKVEHLAPNLAAVISGLLLYLKRQPLMSRQSFLWGEKVKADGKWNGWTCQLKTPPKQTWDADGNRTDGGLPIDWLNAVDHLTSRLEADVNDVASSTPKGASQAGGKADGEQQATSAAEPWLLPIDAPNPDGFYAAETIVTSRTCAGALVLHPNKRVKKDPKLFRDELARPKLKTKVLCRDTTSKFDVELIFKTKELYDAHISQLAQVSEFVKTLPKYRG